MAERTTTATPGPPLNHVLFLCTGNYYRSRFAEELFNTLADEADLNWKASSRGLGDNLGDVNMGPISLFTLEGLETRGVPVDEPIRFPLPARRHDLSGADLIIALKETEHRPLLAKHFPRWQERVVYWHVDDVDQAPADEALAQIEAGVRKLIHYLTASGFSRS